MIESVLVKAMRNLCLVLFTLFLSNHGHCQVLQFGKCPQVEPVKFFDIESFLGRWYEIERFPVWYENGHCSSKRIEACGRRIELEHVFVKDGIQFVLRVNSSYTPGDEAVFQIENNGIAPWFEGGHCSSKRIEAWGRRIELEHVFVKDGIQFVLRVNSSYTPGDEAVFQIENNGIDTLGVPITVIATDYSQHALLYGCKDSTMYDIKYSVAWILSRNRTLPEETTDELKRTLNRIPNTSHLYLEQVRQDPAICAHHWTAFVEGSDYDYED